MLAGGEGARRADHARSLGESGACEGAHGVFDGAWEEIDEWAVGGRALAARVEVDGGEACAPGSGLNGELVEECGFSAAAGADEK
jgi:hypothetical protein